MDQAKGWSPAATVIGTILGRFKGIDCLIASCGGVCQRSGIEAFRERLCDLSVPSFHGFVSGLPTCKNSLLMLTQRHSRTSLIPKGGFRCQLAPQDCLRLSRRNGRTLLNTQPFARVRQSRLQDEINPNSPFLGGFIDCMRQPGSSYPAHADCSGVLVHTALGNQRET